ncbi:dihydrolipoyl dehydrogenase, partial [Candidatus Poribacteria bacterium]|nr:dihydrolipoyl dehydrogenase [Candidatus Poribacteria bacterium]
MNQRTNSTQLAVIGGGPGGYAAAFLAADLGMQVTLIDLEANPGGVCLYRGCIPSKALLHLAKVITDSREAVHWGIEFGEPVLHLDQVRSWKEGVVQKLTQGLGTLRKQRNIHFIQGRASFLDARTLKIQTEQTAETTLSFDHAILATGSRPATIPNLNPPHPPFQRGEGGISPRILDSTAALELRDIPHNMLVVGGGYIGLELGSVYAALGTQVSVVEMTSSLLPGVDRDLVTVLSKRLAKQFHAIMRNTKVVQMEEEADAIRVRLEGENVEAPELTFEKVLIAVGRKPNSSGLGLGNTKVEIDPRGFVQVDAQRRTKEPTIYAIGDVAGEPMLAHKASHEGRIAVEAIAGHNVAFEPRAIPAVVFTDPEIAWCGLTETQAKSESRPVKIARFPWGASGRARTLERDDGLTKLIIDPDTERV